MLTFKQYLNEKNLILNIIDRSRKPKPTNLSHDEQLNLAVIGNNTDRDALLKQELNNSTKNLIAKHGTDEQRHTLIDKHNLNDGIMLTLDKYGSKSHRDKLFAKYNYKSIYGKRK